jgi:Undecaprenyl-phosphate galactose phosphotransferase WbaP
MRGAGTNSLDARSAKRAFDIAGSFLLLLLLSPLLMCLVFLLKLTGHDPVVFSQERVGFEGRPFRCLKFRTMVFNADELLQEYISSNPEARSEWENARKLRNDPRVTSLGKFLRKTSMDELPQLINVLAGDMSFVGPRPIVAEEISRYGDKIREYTSVQPGITGLWQVSGRSNCSYAERVELDARYVSEWNLLMDMYIMLRTVPAILRQDGSY